MSVARAEREISSREFAEWFALDKLVEPFGDERADLRAGIIASTVANSVGNKTTAADFVLEFGEPEEERPKRTQATITNAFRMAGLEVVQG